MNSLRGGWSWKTNNDSIRHGSRTHGALPPPLLADDLPNKDPRKIPWQRSGSSSPRLRKVSLHIFTHYFVSTSLPAGKRTFGNLFNKVKAKMAEMDQQKPQNAGAASASGSQPQWDYAQASSPHAQRQPAQQPSYYDPNPSSPPVPAANRPSFTASPQPANAVQGYDISTSPSSGGMSATTYLMVEV